MQSVILGWAVKEHVYVKLRRPSGFWVSLSYTENDTCSRSLTKAKNCLLICLFPLHSPRRPRAHPETSAQPGALPLDALVLAVASPPGGMWVYPAQRRAGNRICHSVMGLTRLERWRTKKQKPGSPFLIKAQTKLTSSENSYRKVFFSFLFSVFKMLVFSLATAEISGPLPLLINCTFYDRRQIKFTMNLLLQNNWEANLFGGWMQ